MQHNMLKKNKKLVAEEITLSRNLKQVIWQGVWKVLFIEIYTLQS